ncbi:MAG: TolC family protein [Candidatus Muiribacteriota bacterium]
MNYNLISKETENSYILNIDKLWSNTLKNNSQINAGIQDLKEAYSEVYGAEAQFHPVWQIYGQKSVDNSPLTEAQQPGFQDGQLTEDTFSYGMSYDKKLFNGMQLSSELIFQRKYRDTLPSEEKISNSILSFKLSIPLSSQRGKIPGMQREIADILYQAEVFNYEYNVSEIFLNTMYEYVQAIASQRKYNIAQTSEENMLTLKKDTKKLISANQIPGSEINKIQTAVFQKKSETGSFETLLFEKLHNLKYIIGLEQNVNNIKLAALQFELIKEPFFENKSLQDYMESAIQNRLDLKAAKLRLKAANKHLVLAEDGLQKDFYIELDSDLKGLSEDEDAESLTKSWSDNQTDISYSLSFIKDITSNWGYKKQTHAKALAQKNRAEIWLKDKIKSIKKEVSVSYKKMVNGWDTLQRSKKAHQFARVSLDAEIKKFNMNMSTILEVLDVEETFNQSELNLIEQEAVFLGLFLNFLHTQGRLIKKTEDGSMIINLEDYMNYNQSHVLDRR